MFGNNLFYYDLQNQRYASILYFQEDLPLRVCNDSIDIQKNNPKRKNCKLNQTCDRICNG